MQIHFESNGPHGEMFIPSKPSKDKQNEEDSLDSSEPAEGENPLPDAVQ